MELEPVQRGPNPIAIDWIGQAVYFVRERVGWGEQGDMALGSGPPTDLCHAGPSVQRIGATMLARATREPDAERVHHAGPGRHDAMKDVGRTQGSSPSAARCDEEPHRERDLGDNAEENDRERGPGRDPGQDGDKPCQPCESNEHAKGVRRKRRTRDEVPQHHEEARTGAARDEACRRRPALARHLGSRNG